jgi:Icc protein
MKLLWLSDIHLEFLTLGELALYCRMIAGRVPDAILITGDISKASRLQPDLGHLAISLSAPIFFVLGNHDFYGAGFALVEAQVREICSEHKNLVHLGAGEIIRLTTNTSLIGHRGWSDGRAGLADRSTVRLNDVNLISDFSGLSAEHLFQKLGQLGDESAAYIQSLLPEAAEKADNLIVATHVPPFPSCALYENKPSDPNFSPHFVNTALGHVLLVFAAANPSKNILVLCGHTHHRALFAPLPNLTVKVAHAEYRRPNIAEIISIQD